MTLFSQELRCKPGRADRGVRPYGGYKGYGRRADVGIGPYRGLQEVRWTAQWLSGGGLGAARPTHLCDRCQREGQSPSPTDNFRADVGIGPYGGGLYCYF